MTTTNFVPEFSKLKSLHKISMYKNNWIINNYEDIENMTNWLNNEISKFDKQTIEFYTDIVYPLFYNSSHLTFNEDTFIKLNINFI